MTLSILALLFGGLSAMMVAASLYVVALALGKLETKANAIATLVAPIGGSVLQFQSRQAAALELLAKRPQAATIWRSESTKLLVVNNMHCIVGTEICQPGEDQRVIVAPVRADMFQVKGLRILCHATEIPALEQRVRLLACEINQCPQTQWSESTWVGHPSKGLRGILSDVYAAPAGFAVCVEFAPCTTASLIQRLEFVVRNDNPYPVRIVIEGYGEPIHPNDARARIVEGS